MTAPESTSSESDEQPQAQIPNPQPGAILRVIAVNYWEFPNTIQLEWAQADSIVTLTVAITTISIRNRDARTSGTSLAAGGRTAS
jgi:hypothetical protein